MAGPEHFRPSSNGSRRYVPTCETTPRRRINKRTTYGIAIIVAVLLKILLTWILGVAPDPMLVTANLIVGGVGVVLLVLGRKGRPPAPGPDGTARVSSRHP